MHVLVLSEYTCWCVASVWICNALLTAVQHPKQAQIMYFLPLLLFGYVCNIALEFIYPEVNNPALFIASNPWREVREWNEKKKVMSWNCMTRDA